jgi:queuine tRNA-ribosyltransferase
MELSLRWARRSKAEFERLGNPQRAVRHRAGRHVRALREESLAALVALDLPGYAIGGVSVGEPKDDMRASWRTRRTGCRRTSRAT